MEIIIKGEVSDDPRTRVLAIENITQSICEHTGQDAADGVMMLLTAAVHITAKHTNKPARQTMLLLAESLGHAIAVSQSFFSISEITKSKVQEGK